MKKSIEISGTLICLDDVITVSPIKKWNESYKEYHFEFSYRSYNGNNQKVVISEGISNLYACNEGIITILTVEPLTQLRDKIVKIINTNE